MPRSRKRSTLRGEQPHVHDLVPEDVIPGGMVTYHSLHGDTDMSGPPRRTWSKPRETTRQFKRCISEELGCSKSEGGQKSCQSGLQRSVSEGFHALMARSPKRTTLTGEQPTIPEDASREEFSKASDGDNDSSDGCTSGSEDKPHHTATQSTLSIQNFASMESLSEAFGSEGASEAFMSEWASESWRFEVVSKEKSRFGSENGDEDMVALDFGSGQPALLRTWSRSQQSIVRCMNSQHLFAEPSQTVIILDYDDTLFPTTWLRDVGVPFDTPIRSLVAAHPDNVDVLEIAKDIADCEREAVTFLRLCAKLSAGVHLVTLAGRGWVEDTCDMFMPSLGKAFKELRIPILYAREYAQTEGPPFAPEDARQYWRNLKRAAIVDGVNSFHKQYPGQTWKNIVSIGDADFEREATKSAIERYFRENADEGAGSMPCTPASDGAADVESIPGITLVGSMTPKRGLTSGTRVLDSKVVKVRCKTVTLLDDPTIEELVAEISLLQLWLKALVQRQQGVEIHLTTSADNEEIHRFHRELTGDEPDESISWTSLGGLE